MEQNLLATLYNEFQEVHKARITDYTTFCKGCRDNINKIHTDYTPFISIGESPVAGIGFGTSELTKRCQDAMIEHWDKYSPLLEALKNTVNENNIENLSKLVKEDRGKVQNLFVNRCIITLHYTEVLDIANKKDLVILSDYLKKIGFDIPQIEDCKNDNLNWYYLNREVFSTLAKELRVVDDIQKGTLSCFGWYLKVRLLQVLSLEKTLENCHNLILTGAPGTGKTFMAKQLAERMGAKVSFVQFHPSYDYTDFVEGLRPTGNGSFVRTDGIFKAFCKKAVESWLKKDNTKFVMIIDEINRGEISKIFGELFFSIDPDYRVKQGTLKSGYTHDDVKGFTIQTQYQNLIEDKSDCFYYGFFVPDNLYIIGTMNDIDRSVESLDFAMRRRFTFIECMASENLGMLGKISNPTIQSCAFKKMEALNKAIVDPKKGNLTTAYQLGGAYFVNINHFNADGDDKWEDLWNYHIKGIVYEYYRGQPDAERKVALLKDEYDKA
jgi:hypothetical protein